MQRLETWMEQRRCPRCPLLHKMNLELSLVVRRHVRICLRTQNQKNETQQKETETGKLLSRQTDRPDSQPDKTTERQNDKMQTETQQPFGVKAADESSRHPQESIKRVDSNDSTDFPALLMTLTAGWLSVPRMKMEWNQLEGNRTNRTNQQPCSSSSLSLSDRRS